MRKIIDDDLLQFMGEQESQYLIRPSDLVNEIRTRFANPPTLTGDCLPWSKTHDHFRFFPGQVTLWAGINGHGKSKLIGQVCAWGLKNSWLIASMEMLPAETVEGMIKQIAGSEKPSDEYIQRILRWSDKTLWLYDQTDSIKTERILALVRYAAAKNIHHVVIDSLIKCGIKRDDFVGQAYFVDKLCWLAKTNLIHIHIVHHIRKNDSEKKIPDKFDIRGAGEITDLVDNVLIIHRNKNKEEKPDSHIDEADCYLKIAKQRKLGWEGIFKLWFHKESGQFTSDPNRQMNHWINNEIHV